MKTLYVMLNGLLLIAGTILLSGCDDSTGVVVDVCFVRDVPSPFCRCYKAVDGSEYKLPIEKCAGFTAFSPEDAQTVYDRLIRCKEVLD